MPADSSGNVSRPSSPVPVTGQDADAPQVNVPLNDIYSVLNLLPFLDGRKAWRGSQNLNGYRVTGAADAQDSQDYVTLAQVEALLSVFSPVQTGMIIPYTISSTTPPSGYIFANGGAHSRVALAGLWAAVQAGNNLAATEEDKVAGQYGPGDGTTTFTVPNLYADGGQFIRPMTSGRNIGSVQSDENKAHAHGVTDPRHEHTVRSLPVDRHIGFMARVSTGGTISGISGGGPDNGWALAAAIASEALTGISINSAGGGETRPKNIAYPYIIKT